MTELRRELLDVVSQIRMHLEYQKALGVTAVAILPSEKLRSEPMLQRRENPEKASVPSNMQPTLVPLAGKATVRNESGVLTRTALYKDHNSLVLGEGNAHASLAIIVEEPNEHDGGPGGAAGRLLTDIIVKGMKLRREDVFLCIIVPSGPPGNRIPESDSPASCEQFLRTHFQTMHPRVIMVMGDVAMKTVLNAADDILSLRGAWQTYLGMPLMPTFSPAHLLINADDKKYVWDDIKKVMAKLSMSGK